MAKRIAFSMLSMLFFLNIPLVSEIDCMPWHGPVAQTEIASHKRLTAAGAAGAAGARLCVAFGHVEHGCCKDLHFGGSKMMNNWSQDADFIRFWVLQNASKARR